MPKQVAPSAPEVPPGDEPAGAVTEQPSAPPGYISTVEMETKLKEIEEKSKKQISELTSKLQRDAAKKVKEAESRASQIAMATQAAGDPEKEQEYWANLGRQAYWENWQGGQLEGTGVSVEDPRLDRTNEFTFLSSLNKAVVEDKESELQRTAKEMREALKGAKEELVAEFKKLAAGAKEESGQTDVETAPLRQASRDLVAEEAARWEKEVATFKDSGDQLGFARARQEHNKRLAEAERLMARK